MKKDKKKLKRVDLSPAENAEFQLKIAKIMSRTEWIPVTINKAFNTVIILGTLYFISAIIESLAGKTTFANIFFGIIADFNYKDYALVIFGILGWCYGFSQRKLRMKTIARLSAKNDLLERNINPSKVSSGITTNGKTNKEDKK